MDLSKAPNDIIFELFVQLAFNSTSICYHKESCSFLRKFGFQRLISFSSTSRSFRSFFLQHHERICKNALRKLFGEESYTELSKLLGASCMASNPTDETGRSRPMSDEDRSPEVKKCLNWFQNMVWLHDRFVNAADGLRMLRIPPQSLQKTKSDFTKKEALSALFNYALCSLDIEVSGRAEKGKQHRGTLLAIQTLRTYLSSRCRTLSKHIAIAFHCAIDDESHPLTKAAGEQLEVPLSVIRPLAGKVLERFIFDNRNEAWRAVLLILGFESERSNIKESVRWQLGETSIFMLAQVYIDSKRYCFLKNWVDEFMEEILSELLAEVLNWRAAEGNSK